MISRNSRGRSLTRLVSRSLRLLIGRETCVCGEIVDQLPLAQSTVSQHLKILKESGLIEGEVDGPKVCYLRQRRSTRAVQSVRGWIVSVIFAAVHHALTMNDVRFLYPQIIPEHAMAKVQVYDKAMCCSTGVCGPQVDPALPQFAADLDWLKNEGTPGSIGSIWHKNRPQFASNPVLQKMLAEEGVDCLPLVFVDGCIVSRSEYPSRDNLALWTGTSRKKASLPMAESGGCCGGDTGRC